MRWSFFDPCLFLPFLFLGGLSFFLLGVMAPHLLRSQLIFFLVGIIFYLFFSSTDFKVWGKYGKWFYLLTIFLLLWTLNTSSIRGARRWIEFGVFSIQPSEIMKPFIILTFSQIISQQKNLSFPFFLIVSTLFLFLLILIFKQPDLGNVLVYLSIFLALLFAAGFSWLYFFMGGGIFLVVFPLLWWLIRDYQRQRIMAFLNPNFDPMGVGYNALQSIIAIGSGQFLGLGLGRGTQSRLLFLPEYHTDFVFASLVEELGFLGGGLVLFLYFILLGRMLFLAFKTPEMFGKLVIIGIFTQFFIQIFINIGMNLGLLPITGITLPGISYGGSSLLSIFIGLGLVSSVANFSFPKEKSPLVIR